MLSPQLGWEMLFGLIPLVFILVGGGGMLWAVKHRDGSVQPKSAFVDPVSEKDSSNTLLTTGTSRRAKFIVLTIVALFWNGMVWTFLFFAFRDGSLKSNICPLIFLSVFAVIGLAILGAAVHSFLSIFNPTVQLNLSHAPVRLGDSLTIKWSLAGRFDRITQLTIMLEGREIARYRRGTNTHTDTKVFVKQSIVETARQIEISRGSKAIQVPANSMHTFDSADNHINWFIVVHGDIPNWPDLKDEFKLNVLPLEQTLRTEAPQ